jgi:hypothetical protein
MPADVTDDRRGQRGERRIERLQYRERRRLGTRDGVPAGTLTQEGGQRLYFRQFGHVSEFTDQKAR